MAKIARRIISVTTDFGVQSQGVGIMEAVAYEIAPEIKYINLIHGLPAFDILSAARSLETVAYLPIGNHVCVCDPGVGSSRRALLLSVQRGDCLVGPDNGVLIPAARRLGGLVEAISIENSEYMRHPISPIFHGRDVFVPVAAHLTRGIPPHKFGPIIDPSELCPAAYDEAVPTANGFSSTIIHVNHYGSAILNIQHPAWDQLFPALGIELLLILPNGRHVPVRHGSTFSDVPRGLNVILKDDYGRVEVATNFGSFASEHNLAVGDHVDVRYR
jgi:S-adenosylmethionine hydrolase